VASQLVPTIDVARLCPSSPDDASLSAALSLLHITATATVKDLRAALSKAFAQDLSAREANVKDLSRDASVKDLSKDASVKEASVKDPTAFWALHALATQRLGFRSLADFLGTPHTIQLDAQKSDAGEVQQQTGIAVLLLTPLPHSPSLPSPPHHRNITTLNHVAHIHHLDCTHPTAPPPLSLPPLCQAVV
jgi:hypothetical protein